MVQATPYNLSGQNVRVGMIDQGNPNPVHNDFNNRTTIVT
jgi:hypothetical protein